MPRVLRENQFTIAQYFKVAILFSIAIFFSSIFSVGSAIYYLVYISIISVFLKNFIKAPEKIENLFLIYYTVFFVTHRNDFSGKFFEIPSTNHHAFYALSAHLYFLLAPIYWKIFTKEMDSIKLSVAKIFLYFGFYWLIIIPFLRFYFEKKFIVETFRFLPITVLFAFYDKSKPFKIWNPFGFIACLFCCIIGIFTPYIFSIAPGKEAQFFYYDFKVNPPSLLFIPLFSVSFSLALMGFSNVKFKKKKFTNSLGLIFSLIGLFSIIYLCAISGYYNVSYQEY